MCCSRVNVLKRKFPSSKSVRAGPLPSSEKEPPNHCSEHGSYAQLMPTPNNETRNTDGLTVADISLENENNNNKSDHASHNAFSRFDLLTQGEPNKNR